MCCPGPANPVPAAATNHAADASIITLTTATATHLAATIAPSKPPASPIDPSVPLPAPPPVPSVLAPSSVIATTIAFASAVSATTVAVAAANSLRVVFVSDWLPNRPERTLRRQILRLRRRFRVHASIPSRLHGPSGHTQL